MAVNNSRRFQDIASKTPEIIGLIKTNQLQKTVNTFRFRLEYEMHDGSYSEEVIVDFPTLDEEVAVRFANFVLNDIPRSSDLSSLDDWDYFYNNLYFWPDGASNLNKASITMFDENGVEWEVGLKKE